MKFRRKMTMEEHKNMRKVINYIFELYYREEEEKNYLKEYFDIEAIKDTEKVLFALKLKMAEEECQAYLLDDVFTRPIITKEELVRTMQYLKALRENPYSRVGEDPIKLGRLHYRFLDTLIGNTTFVYMWERQELLGDKDWGLYTDFWKLSKKYFEKRG